MFESIFNFTTIDPQIFTIWHATLTVLATFALGGIICATYVATGRKSQYNQSFLITLIMIPAIIAIIILMVGNNIARAFSLAGAFSIIRFRSAPGSPRDITYIFFALAAGLGCGVGLIGYAFLYVALLCIFMLILYFFKFGIPKNPRMTLKIVIPEDLDYSDLFNDTLTRYSSFYELTRVRTVDLGTLFQLVYTIILNDGANEKELIDELRCKNGNLTITLSRAPSDDMN